MASSWLAGSRALASSRAAGRPGRALSVISRSSGADQARFPWPCEPECVENDYYRFLNHPRD